MPALSAVSVSPAGTPLELAEKEVAHFSAPSAQCSVPISQRPALSSSRYYKIIPLAFLVKLYYNFTKLN
jgi:hypothetical protein